MATHTTLPVQQPQASTYNHPCEDLLDGGRREYLDMVVPLYRASIEGDLEAAKVILQGHEYLLRYSMTDRKEAPLHVAAAGNNIKLVRYLVSMMSTADMELQNGDGNTAFCIAAISGNVDMAKIMVEKNRALPIICGSENMTPLYLAAFHRKKNMVAFLYEQSNRMMGNDWTDDKRNDVLLKCIQSNIFDMALVIMEDNEDLPQDKHLWDVLQVLARKPEAFQQVFLRDTSNIIDALYYIVEILFLKERNSTKLLRLLWKRIMKRPKNFIDEILRGPMTVVEKSPGHRMETYPSQVLFIAARKNNKRFLVELIREYPDLLWRRNDDGQTIFHIAVSHRYQNIYSLLYEIGSIKNQITPILDQHGNNILHLVGKKQEQNDYQDWLTLSKDDDYMWYQEVKRILPPPCREVKNAAGKTPQQLFIENHKELNSDDIKWMNDTINVSMLVAALVCTISFAVVYSVPGGFDQNHGLPVLLHAHGFTNFVGLDCLSFIMSSSSILLFVSVTLCRRRHRQNMDFLLDLWFLAQLFLGGSVFCLLLAFGTGICVVYQESEWTNLLLYATCLVSVLGLFSVVFLSDTRSRETDSRSGRFKPKNRMLYPKSS